MKLKDKFKIVLNHHARLLKRYDSLGTTIGQLTSYGCIDASEYWKDGKYLYFLYPMKNGKRKKIYIGNHPLRIEEARQKLANYSKRLELIETRKKILVDIELIDFLSVDLLNICSKSDLSALFSVSNGYSKSADPRP